MGGHRRIHLGAFQLDADTAELSRDNQKVRLPDQSFRILQVLLERAGDVVTRNELRQRLWPSDTFVDFDAGLNNAVKKLRDALQDSSDQPQYIETIPRRGYRLIAPVGAPSQVRRRTVAVAAVLCGALGAAVFFSPTGAWFGLRLRGQPPVIRSLVVMPFDNLIGDPAQEYIVDGITDAVTTNLAQIRTLRVIPRTSSMHYKRTSKPLTEIARELAVEAAVAGTVARAGDRVVVRVQLIRADGDQHVWADTYDRNLRDVLTMQAVIALAIARAVHLRVGSAEEQRLLRSQTVDPAAYDAYLRGRFELNRRIPGATLKAIQYFEDAIARDSRYAPAYSGLSDAYRHLDIQWLAAPGQAMPKAEAAARQALAIDDSLGEAHASLAGVLYRYRWDWLGAEREFRRSLELEPNSAETHRAYSIYLGVMRRFDDSLEHAQRARQLNPLSPELNFEVVQTLFWANRSEEAMVELDRTRQVFPAARRGDSELGYEHLRRRRWAEAVEALEKANDPARPNPWLGFAYAASGRIAEARQILETLHENARREYLTPQAFATVHLGLGERDEALRWLEVAYPQRAFELRGFTKGFVEFMGDDPRFQDLLGRMGLAGFKEFQR